jgi:hypothetical protein
MLKEVSSGINKKGGMNLSPLFFIKTNEDILKKSY